MAEHSVTITPDRVRLTTIAGLALVFILYGLVITGPRASIEGLLSILAARDMLMTDYMVLGGIGGAFLNAGLLTLIAVGVYWRAGALVGGGSVACLFLLLGFALFGKNILNVWPSLGGATSMHVSRANPLPPI